MHWAITYVYLVWQDEYVGRTFIHVEPFVWRFSVMPACV
jgi:hypothetical protein